MDALPTKYYGQTLVKEVEAVGPRIVLSLDSPVANYLEAEDSLALDAPVATDLEAEANLSSVLISV